MSKIMTKRSLAKSLMDLALEKDAVEYTAAYQDVSTVRTECYKLRSFARDLGTHSYDKLRFRTRIATAGMQTLTVEKT